MEGDDTSNLQALVIWFLQRDHEGEGGAGSVHSEAGEGDKDKGIPEGLPFSTFWH